MADTNDLMHPKDRPNAQRSLTTGKLFVQETKGEA